MKLPFQNCKYIDDYKSQTEVKFVIFRECLDNPKLFVRSERAPLLPFYTLCVCVCLHPHLLCNPAFCDRPPLLYRAKPSPPAMTRGNREPEWQIHGESFVDYYYYLLDNTDRKDMIELM